ncbi:MAG: DUF2330 domain-containing protein [Candidatus Sumerlaeia bacterium]
MKPGLTPWLLVFALLAGSSTARADGAFFPASVGVRTMPSMPVQRAVIVHDGTTETLLIESMMNAPQGSDFTWILPLPAEPFEIGKGSAGAMNTLFLRFGPKMISASQIGLRFWAVLLFLSLCVAGMILAFDKKSSGRWESLFVIVLIFVALAAISVGSGSSSVGAQARLLKRETVGNYDVAVLRGDSSEPIARWLAGNHFAPMNPGAAAAIDAYAREGWVFLAAKLHRAGTGVMAPHPLQVRFHTPRPIYPMRLTAAAGGPVFVKLAIYSNKIWRSPVLETEYASQIMRGDDYVCGNGGWLYHADLAKLLGFNDGWLTVMSGTVEPGRMREDFTFDADAAIPELPEYYTPRAAVGVGVMIALWVLTAGFPAIALAFKHRSRSKGKYAALGLVLVAIVAGAIGSRSVPTMPGARDVRMMGGIPIGRNEGAMREAVVRIKRDPKMTREEIGAKLLAELKDERNPFTGEPLRIEFSPGNLSVTSTDPGYTLGYYDYDCRFRPVATGQ